MDGQVLVGAGLEQPVGRESEPHLVTGMQSSLSSVHRALEMVDVPVHNIAMVVTPANQLCGLYVGHVRASWSQAADLSDRVHIVYREASFPVVLGQAPAMYDEIWVAGKVMYKLEQVVADGGRLIIYGPHITHISRTWGKWIEKVERTKSWRQLNILGLFCRADCDQRHLSPMCFHKAQHVVVYAEDARKGSW